MDQLFFVGLVMEKSVLFSALDAKLLLPDAEVFVVEDCCRGTSSSAMAEAIRRVRTRVSVCMIEALLMG